MKNIKRKTKNKKKDKKIKEKENLQDEKQSSNKNSVSLKPKRLRPSYNYSKHDLTAITGLQHNKEIENVQQFKEEEEEVISDLIPLIVSKTSMSEYFHLKTSFTR